VKQVDAPSSLQGHKFQAKVGIPSKYQGAEKKNPNGHVVGAPWSKAIKASPYFDDAQAAARWIDRLCRNPDWLPFLNEMASNKAHHKHALRPMDQRR
jgi:hypothetical protein